MKKLIILFVFVWQAGNSQNTADFKASTPDSVKQLCDRVFLRELGKKMFETHLKFDSTEGSKTVHEDGQVRVRHKLYYTFSYPGIKGASVPLSMNYDVYSGKGHLQSGWFLRTDRTDLPVDITKRGDNVMDIEKARVAAVQADSLMAKAKAFFVLGQDSFYWHFQIYKDPDPKREMDVTLSHNVLIDPYNGKVLSVFTK